MDRVRRRVFMKMSHRGGMSSSKSILGTDAVADSLRKLARESADGALLGSEKDLIAAIGTSRATLRQAARLIEREGLLKVRRGIRGGYFASRTGESAIEYAVSAYLEMLDISPRDLSAIASVLWVEALRKAAAAQTEAGQALAVRFRRKLDELGSHPSFVDVVKFEREYRKAVLELIKNPYMQLIFNVNSAYAYRAHRLPVGGPDETARHRDFVRAWWQAKLIELEAIAAGDQALAVMAARASRDASNRRVWGHEYG